MTTEWKKISGSTLKIIGIVTMFVDHVGLAVLGRMIRSMPAEAQPYHLTDIYSAMRWVGRLAFPIFCFLLAEGFARTRSKSKYLLRLGIFALISEIPYDLAFSAKVLEFGHQNVYFTLFLGLLSLCAYVYLDEHKPPVLIRWLMCAAGIALSGRWLAAWSWQYVQRYILQRFPAFTVFGNPVTVTAVFIVICVFTFIFLLCCCLRMGTDKMLRFGTNLAVLFFLMTLADMLHTDYSGMGVLTITVMYILRRNHVLGMAGGCVTLTLKSLTEIPAFLTLIPIAMYNGERGLKLKYVFYVFYPAHLLLLWFAAWLMGTAFVPVF